MIRLRATNMAAAAQGRIMQHTHSYCSCYWSRCGLVMLSDHQWRRNWSGASVSSQQHQGPFREERDNQGAVQIPADRYWGARTQRCLQETEGMGEGLRERMPEQIIQAMGVLKKAACTVNMKDYGLEREVGNAIVAAAQEVADGKLNSHFPLRVWQTGSGAASNANADEVIAHRATELLFLEKQEEQDVSAEEVGMGQSVDDAGFAAVVHIAAVLEIRSRLLPRLQGLYEALAARSEDFKGVIKTGRTHSQDAVPITLGQELSGYGKQVRYGMTRLKAALPRLYQLAPTSSLPTPSYPAAPTTAFDKKVAMAVAADTNIPFVAAPNPFEALAAHDALLEASAALNCVAASLTKIANDIRMLASGPRCGLGELSLELHEPCDVLAMVCAQVTGNHVAITVAGSSGALQRSAVSPLLAAALLQALRLTADATASFTVNCVLGTGLVSQERIQQCMRQSLMLVTVLNPVIGYDKAERMTRLAHQQGCTLKEAALELGYLTSQQFDELVVPEKMLQPGTHGQAY